MAPMARVHIPSAMRDLTQGRSSIDVPGETVCQLVEGLETQFPGLAARLVEDGRIRPGLQVFVDGETRRAGLRTKVSASSEVFFLQALGGG